MEVVAEVGLGGLHVGPEGTVSLCPLEEAQLERAVSRGGCPHGDQDYMQGSWTERCAQRLPR